MSPLVATQEGLFAAAAFAFMAGAAAAFIVRAVGRMIDQWSSKGDDPFDDPRNWH